MNGSTYDYVTYIDICLDCIVSDHLRCNADAINCCFLLRMNMMMMLMKKRSDTTEDQDPISIILGGIVYDASMILFYDLRSTIPFNHVFMPV